MNASVYDFEIIEAESGRRIYLATDLFLTDFKLPAGVTLDYHLVYQWRTRARNETGGDSGWTIFRGFMAYDPNLVVTAKSPFGYIDHIDPVFTWEPLAGAAHYEFLLKDKESQQVIVKAENLTSTSYALPSDLLEFNRVYHWQVRAVSAEGEKFFWSPIRGFLPYDPSMVPKLIAPFSYIDTNRPTFQWQQVADAKEYHLQVFKKSTNSLFYETYTDAASVDLPPDLALEYGQNYVWQVRSISTSGESSIWSPVFGIVAREAELIPTQIQPYAYIDTLSPLFQWSAVERAVGYDFYLVDSRDQSIVHEEVDLTTNQFTLPASTLLEADVAYRWFVRSKTQEKNSFWTGPMGFIARSEDIQSFEELEPLALSPTSHINHPKEISFKWEPLDGSSNYELYIYDANSGKVVHEAYGLQSNNYVLPDSVDLRPGEQYSWKVRGVNGLSQRSQSSTVLYFSIAPQLRATDQPGLRQGRCSEWSPMPYCDELPAPPTPKGKPSERGDRSQALRHSKSYGMLGGK